MKNETLQTLAKFEHKFHLNWYEAVKPNHDKIIEALKTVWEQTRTKALQQEIELTKEAVFKVNHAIASHFKAQDNASFRNSLAWTSFLNETVAKDDKHLSKTNIIDTEAWFLASLFHDHLEIFRLSTAWIFINAINIQSGEPSPELAQSNLTTFENHLSYAGFPAWDAETLRGNIQKYGMADDNMVETFKSSDQRP